MSSWEQGHSIYSWTQLLGGSSIKARKMNEFSRNNIKDMSKAAETACTKTWSLPEVTNGHLSGAVHLWLFESISFCVQTLTALRRLRITLEVTKQLLCREDSTFFCHETVGNFLYSCYHHL